jgi:hypothetical protein
MRPWLDSMGKSEHETRRPALRSHDGMGWASFPAVYLMDAHDEYDATGARQPTGRLCCVHGEAGGIRNSAK